MMYCKLQSVVLLEVLVSFVCEATISVINYFASLPCNIISTYDKFS